MKAAIAPATSVEIAATRRRVLYYLLTSPLLASGALSRDAFAQTIGGSGDNSPIPDLKQALDVFDFEAVAKQKLPPAHWGYLATGVDDDATIAANRAGFTKFGLRMRRMVDVSAIDMSMQIFGEKFASPIMLSPVSSQRAFHNDGELADAKAARVGNHLQILSTLTSYDVEAVLEARGGGVWYQLYPTDQWEVTVAVLKRVRAAGCPTLVVTADLNGGSNRETLARWIRKDTRDCSNCHAPGPPGSMSLQQKAMFKGIDMSHVKSVTSSTMTWDTIKRMRDYWPGKILIKGIVTHEDAALCVRHGLDGIYVSNHGGRAEASGRSTIEVLSEVVAAANKKIPVVIDSGFRRGTDIFKALALGATAVGVGRPYVWGLAAYGQPGVEAVLRILRRELNTVMRQAGTRSLAEITAASITAPHV